MFNNVNVNDNYCSHKEMWEKIKDFLPSDKKIWSPFYCDGKQKEYFKEMGFDIIHEDRDFFSYTPEYDLIIDNPPFSKLYDICFRLKELDKPFILISFPKIFLTKKFQNIFKEHLLNLYIFQVVLLFQLEVVHMQLKMLQPMSSLFHLVDSLQ